MAKTILITDIRINAIRIERDVDNNIKFTADYQYMNEDGIIDSINLQVNTEDRPLTDFPVDIRNALIVVNSYAAARIKTAEGI